MASDMVSDMASDTASDIPQPTRAVLARVCGAARTARVAGDGAAHGALLLTRGIGREEQPLRLGGAPHVGDDGTRADLDGPLLGVDLADVAEIAEREKDASVRNAGAGGAALPPGGRDARAGGGGFLEDLFQLLDGRRARDGLGDEFETAGVAGMREADVVVEGEVRH
jgi:hypothetical protein